MWFIHGNVIDRRPRQQPRVPRPPDGPAHGHERRARRSSVGDRLQRGRNPGRLGPRSHGRDVPGPGREDGLVGRFGRDCGRAARQFGEVASGPNDRRSREEEGACS